MELQIPKKIILWGGTGQAIVNKPIIEQQGSEVIAIFDDTAGLRSPFEDIPIYEGWDGFEKWIADKNPDEIGFSIAIGNPHGNIRIELHNKLTELGLQPATLIHNTAFVSGDAQIGEGSQIMAAAVIQPGVKTGIQCIINTKASVDHECILEDGVEIAPGATLCGCVEVKRNAWIAAGATILPGIRIGENSIVGAGAMVNKDVPDNITVMGVPARTKSKRY